MDPRIIALHDDYLGKSLTRRVFLQRLAALTGSVAAAAALLRLIEPTRTWAAARTVAGPGPAPWGRALLAPAGVPAWSLIPAGTAGYVNSPEANRNDDPARRTLPWMAEKVDVDPRYSETKMLVNWWDRLMGTDSFYGLYCGAVRIDPCPAYPLGAMAYNGGGARMARWSRVLVHDFATNTYRFIGEQVVPVDEASYWTPGSPYSQAARYHNGNGDGDDLEHGRPKPPAEVWHLIGQNHDYSIKCYAPPSMVGNTNGLWIHGNLEAPAVVDATILALDLDNAKHVKRIGRWQSGAINEAIFYGWLVAIPDKKFVLGSNHKGWPVCHMDLRGCRYLPDDPIEIFDPVPRMVMPKSGPMWVRGVGDGSYYKQARYVQSMGFLVEAIPPWDDSDPYRRKPGAGPFGKWWFRLYDTTHLNDTPPRFSLAREIGDPADPKSRVVRTGFTPGTLPCIDTGFDPNGEKQCAEDVAGGFAWHESKGAFTIFPGIHDAPTTRRRWAASNFKNASGKYVWWIIPPGPTRTDWLNGTWTCEQETFTGVDIPALQGDRHAIVKAQHPQSRWQYSPLLDGYVWQTSRGGPCVFIKLKGPSTGRGKGRETI